MSYSDADIEIALAQPRSTVLPIWIRIDPMAEDAIQPASVDLRLGDRFMHFAGCGAEHYGQTSAPATMSRPAHHPRTVDLADRKAEMDTVQGDGFLDGICSRVDSYYDLAPGAFALGSTVERVALSSGIVGRVEGKSSLGRLGLMVHVTAGFIDPGFDGHVTLEFFNASPNVIRLRPGLFICQMSFAQTNTPARKPYGHPDLKSRYQGAEGVEASKG